MSNLDPVATKQFESEVHHQFTPMGPEFAALARYRSNVVGNQVQFPVFGYSMMHEHVVGQPIKPANGDRTPVTLTLKNWAVGDWTSIFQQQTVNFDEKREFAKVIAQAMRNRVLQMIIDALKAATDASLIPTSNKVAINVSGTNAKGTVAAVRAAAEILDNRGVPEQDRVFMARPTDKHNILKDPLASSHDYVDRKGMVDGQLPEFYGFGLSIVPDLKEGGMPTDSGGTNRLIYAYGKQALALATGVWQGATVQRYNLYAGDFVSGLLSSAAVVVDPLGVVEITVLP